MVGEIAKSPASRRRFLKRLVGAGLVLALLAAGSAFTFRNQLFRGNFGVVDPGVAYRSAQPGETMDAVLKQNQIATVLNLRGGSSHDPWYVDEVETTERLKVDFYDFPMVATERPSRRQLLTVIDILGRCQYPLLIHCKSGSDRTGLVSALYLMMRKGVPPLEAERAFSLYYGHIPLFGTRRLHEPLREYAEWLERNHQAHSPERFRGWVEHEYRSDDALVTLEPYPKGPRARAGMEQARRPEASRMD